ncbi:MATE family efflux transporter [Vibrio splendidus]|uniref:MATE family efflux transporter n=2 Tax=Vibrio TaxID=662 RepID=UPI000C825AE6|nr:MATE family efflux transporter [Vibrio splendidus]PMI82744.1 MATE family efflux transporter [Vibrio splendidus]PMK59959.1 MATE family efflux transporter [Vibrio splendidus]
MKLTHKDYSKIAFPFIVSTVTQPLLGAVDTAVIGQLGVAELIGGVAIGAVIMNTLYWLFGFFRVSTTGQSAIALGRNNLAEQASSLIRPLLLALCIGVVFILSQSLIWQGAEWLIEPEAAVGENAKIYFDIMIYGAPFVLINYTIIGWLMGQAKAKATLFTQVVGNVLNIVLDIVFVMYLDMGIVGVAIATLIAQVTTFAIGLIFVFKTCQFSLWEHACSLNISPKDLKAIVSSNMDLLLRTVCILVFFNMMARVGSQLGSNVLATNAILMQVTFIISYMFDGIANASSVFAGKAVGQKNPTLLDNVIKLNTQWTTAFVVVMTLLTVTFKHQVVMIFTTLPELIEIYLSMSPWLLVFPLVAGYGLTFYGIFTGTATTRPVRDSSFITLIVFLIVQFFAVLHWGNHGLWFAFTLFYVGRFIFLIPFIGQVKRKCL